MQLPRRYTLKARWIFPIESPPLINGMMVVDRGRIVDMGMHDPPARVPLFGLGAAAILPGFVNAHTHLEFSDVPAPLGHPGMPLPEWLPLGMQLREQAGRPPLVERIAQGLRECAASGTTLVGEIATTPWNPPPLEWPAEDPPKIPEVVAFYEMIAPIAPRVGATLETAMRHLSAGEEGIESGWLAGLSPHAPYTACRELLCRAAALAAEQHVPLAIHLAESPEEVQWLAGQGGPIGELLASRGATPELAPPPVASPGEVLELLGNAPRVLVVHGNYLNDQDIAVLAAQPEKFALVYCPRTHSYFQHAPHPLEKLVERGALVALGTDGRGSNPDLSLLAEMRHMKSKHPRLSSEQIFEIGTLGGARALGRANETGSLAVGKRADLCIMEIPPFVPEKFSPVTPEDIAPKAAATADDLLAKELPVLATIVGGRAIYERGETG